MTTATISNGKRVTLTIEQKARLLQVIDIHEAGVLAVRSNEDPTKAYGVRHNGRVATYCPCAAYGHCSHKQAVNWHLEAERRNLYTEMFNIYG